jgi:glycosyltransferase involved in cell wall biosynthesis
MRITYLHQYFNTPEMSGGTRSYEMARRLVAKGHEVNMVTSWREDDGRKRWFETQEAGIHVHWLPVPYSNRMGYGERIRAFFRFAWKAAHKAAALPADVVFATSTPLTIALPGAYAAWRQKVPMVFEVRDLWPELPIAVGALRNPVLQAAARFLERFAYARSSRIVALSPGMKDGVVQSGFPAEKVSVIPNSADLDLFDPEKADGKNFRRKHPEIGDAPLVVYAGAMGKINGVDYLPRIASASKECGLGLQFAVIGKNGQEEQKVRQTALKLNVLDDNFHIYPSVAKNKMPDILAAADVALSLVIDLKPLWANSANKFFDALASGTPVAINYRGWQADLLEETGAGIILPPDDPDKAAAMLAAFVADKKILQKAGQAARNLAEERFSRDKLAGQLERMLVSTLP